MNYLSIAGLTLGIALVAVLFIGLLSYVSQLVKNAYQIKVEIRNDMEAGLKKIEDELGKKSKWMRSELGEDVGRIKQAIDQEMTQRLKVIEDNLTAMSRDLDSESRAERADIRVTMNQLRKRVAAIDVEISTLKDEVARRVALGQKRRDNGKGEADGDVSAEALGEVDSDPDVLEVNLPGPGERAARDSSAHRTANGEEPFQAGFPHATKEPSAQVSSLGGGVHRMQLPEFSPEAGS